jgi:ABC-type Fe3+/spermidine/putrescine transport system ATPase subunit
MNNGLIEQVGTPEQIYDYPQTPFVARFIGSINEFSGTLSSITGTHASVRSTGCDFNISATRRGSRPLPALANSSSVSVLIRPEKIRIEHGATERAPNRIAGILREILYQGAMTQFLVESGEFPGMMIAVMRPTTTLHQYSHGLEVSEPVTLSFESDDLLMMSAESPVA